MNVSESCAISKRVDILQFSPVWLELVKEENKNSSISTEIAEIRTLFSAIFRSETVGFGF